MIGEMLTHKLAARPKGWIRRNFLVVMFFILAFASYATLLYHYVGAINWIKTDAYWLLYIPTFGFLITGFYFLVCGDNQPKK